VVHRQRGPFYLWFFCSHPWRFGLTSLFFPTSLAGLISKALQLGEEILSYNDGGFGRLGSGPGPSYGITFSPEAVARGGFTCALDQVDTCAALVLFAAALGSGWARLQGRKA